MLFKRNCRKSHFVLTFFNFLWFISIFLYFCGPQHREIEIIIFLKTGYCPNCSRYKPSKYWNFAILTAIPTPKLGFHKNMIIWFSLLSHGVLHYFVANYHDFVTFWTNYHNFEEISLFCQLFFYRFAKDIFAKVTENVFLHDLVMLLLRQKTPKITKNTLKQQHFDGLL